MNAPLGIYGDQPVRRLVPAEAIVRLERVSKTFPGRDEAPDRLVAVNSKGGVHAGAFSSLRGGRGDTWNIAFSMSIVSFAKKDILFCRT